MTWQNRFIGYEPIPNVDARLRGLNTPQVGPAEFQTVVMHRFSKTPQDVGLTRTQTRGLIKERIVPEGIYPVVIAVACSSSLKNLRRGSSPWSPAAPVAASQMRRPQRPIDGEEL